MVVFRKITIFVLFSILLNLICTVQSTGVTTIVEDSEETKKLNKDFCGYEKNIASAEVCYDIKKKNPNSKSECCAINWNNKFACLPQSASKFKDSRADFTIDKQEAYISCSDKSGTAASTFFSYSYCGKKNKGLTEEDCKPLIGETQCCLLVSSAKMTDKTYKTLRTCLSVDRYFNNTVVAQTLFSGSDTNLYCHENGVVKNYVITKTGLFLKFSLAVIFIFFILF
jgi:hypothetical protein